MAAHLKILRKGVETWNKWKREHRPIYPDLSGANLSGTELFRAELYGADLSRADLSRTDLIGANLSEANLFEANLTGATLNGADLSMADLGRANLSGANLSEANLSYTGLRGANLSGANLSGANLSRAGLAGTDFSDANFAQTVLADTDLSEAKGLESVRHVGPCSIGVDTFFQSAGKIPEAFLRGAGVPDVFIQYAASLARKPIELYSAFISYSSKDKDLAERLYADLQAKGVRCWFAPEDLKIGDKFRTEIDRAIRVHDKLLLLLSANSMLSDWVEKEVETAFERERRDKRIILFPVRLDDTIMDAVEGWAADIRRTRHIGDFTKWKDHDSYRKAFDRLLRDLKAKTSPPVDSGQV